MEPLISICMPNHNYGHFIGEAIESVLAQTYKNFELIIVDDVSTDNSVEIIKSYNDPRIKLYQNETNLHCFKTINRGIEHSKGELVCTLHSDDKYESTFLEKIVKAYNKYPDKKVFVAGTYLWHFEEKQLIPKYPYDSEGVKDKKEVFLRLGVENNIGNGVNVVFHRDCLNKIGPFSLKYKYIGDYDYWFRLSNEFDFVYIPELLTYYRIHDSNITHDLVKNFDFFKEGLEVLAQNLMDSKLINKDEFKELLTINEMQYIHRAFYVCLKYKSGNICRNALKLNDQHSQIVLNPYKYFVQLMSYFFSEKRSKLSLNFLSFLGRLILYPNKIYINHCIDKLVSKNMHLELK